VIRERGLAATLFGLWWSVVTDLGDTVLVWLGFKYWPATGHARWVRDRLPKPDLQAIAWQSVLRPVCPHRDSAGVSWAIPAEVTHEGAVRPARVCTQCHAYRLVLLPEPGEQGGEVLSGWLRDQGDRP